MYKHPNGMVTSPDRRKAELDLILLQDDSKNLGQRRSSMLVNLSTNTLPTDSLPEYTTTTVKPLPDLPVTTLTNPQTWPAWPVSLVTQSATTVIGAINSYFTSKHAISAFSANVKPGSNSIAVYNDGKLVLPAGDGDFSPGRNIVIYNGPRGEMLFAPPAASAKEKARAHAQARKELEKELRAEAARFESQCPKCGVAFESEKAVLLHRERRPEFCEVHAMCLKGWEEHNVKAEHRVCGVTGCKKKGVDFGSGERYLKHFQKKHAC